MTTKEFIAKQDDQERAADQEPAAEMAKPDEAGGELSEAELESVAGGSPMWVAPP